MASRHIILSPHFDDAVLSLGGLLTKEGSSVSVITFFTGKPNRRMETGWDKESGFANSDAAMEARTEENKKALSSLGVSNYINLPFLDGQYRDTQPSLEELSDAISKYIGPDLTEVHMYGPGLGMHPDHNLVRDVLIEYARKKNGVHCYLYPDLPYALWLLNETGGDYTAVLDRMGTYISQGPEVIQLTEIEIEKKLAGIRYYASQVKPLGGEGMLQGIKEFSCKLAAAANSPSTYCELVYKIRL